MKKFNRKIALVLAVTIVLTLFSGFTAFADEITPSATGPHIVEARLVTGNFIELHWNQSALSGTGQFHERGHGHQDNLTGAGGSLNFTPQSSSDRNNFVVRLNGSTLTQSNNAPYYWNIRNYSRNGVRINQHMTTLRLSSSISATQQNAIINGTSTLTVQVTGNVTNVAGEAVDTTVVTPVVVKPYYVNEVRAPVSNVRVRGSEFVTLQTVQEGARQVDLILSAMPQAVVQEMASNNTMVIFGPGEHSANIPEHRNVCTYDRWDRAEGYGGSTAAASAANVWRYQVAQNGLYPSSYVSNYRDESIFAHEFGHGIHTAFNRVYPSNHPLRQEYLAAYNNLRDKGMWTAYVRDASGGSEMWSTLTSVWFNAMAEGNAGRCNTRAELYTHDRKTYEFFAKIFPHDVSSLSPSWNVPSTQTPTWTDNVSATNLISRPIASTPAIPAVSVPQGTALSAITRPARVQVNFLQYINSSGTNLAAPSSGTSAGSTTLPVTWDTSAYNANVPGVYTLTGTIALVSATQVTGAISNPSNIRPTIQVTVTSIYDCQVCQDAPGGCDVCNPPVYDCEFCQDKPGGCEECWDVTRFDINKDELVDYSDVAFVMFLFGKKASEVSIPEAGWDSFMGWRTVDGTPVRYSDVDVNNDGEINIPDLQLLQKYFTGIW